MKKTIKKILPLAIRNKFRPYLQLGRSRWALHRMEQRLKEEASKTKKPEVVNLNANDICNSKCAMCNIWEQKQGFEFSPEQLEAVLKNELFSEVKHVGITGGEPTLREDLPQLYQAVINAVPGIKGLSIITNAIKEKDVIARIEQVKEVCASNNVPFSMMISVDGYGEMHDKVRGRKGNFDSAMNVYNHFKKLDVPIAIGCTISKVNVWGVDELLDFMKQNEIYGRFRVAEFIQRLYNANKADVVRNFDEDEIYHLQLFFYKLIFQFEKNPVFRNTYRSIINILDGGVRMITCPYQTSGVVLNSRAELAYCAPKSNIIGDALKTSALELYQENTAEKARVINEHCNDCIHDYHAAPTMETRKADWNEQFWKKYIHVKSQLAFGIHKAIKPKKISTQLQVFITGWYGTETVGDKAILGGIIDQLHEKHGAGIDLVITSLYPIITRRTMKELGIAATIIPVYHSDFIAYAKASDIVIMGGGPLMDLEELALPLVAFRIAKASKKKAIVYGCGLGPLTFPDFIAATKEILALADEILLRDNKSIRLAKEWLGNDSGKSIALSGDPARQYLKRFEGRVRKSKNVLRCFLREWTYEYSRDVSHEAFLVLKKKFEGALALFIKNKALELGVEEIVLEHMHNFVVGNDDRDFSRYFIREYFGGENEVPVTYTKGLSTVESTVEAMLSAKHNICMRFHSVVFAHTLETHFTGVDYTKGGKILNFLTDNNALGHLLSVDMLVGENSAEV